MPSARAATSVDAERAAYQTPTRPSRATHCSARGVLPYPAGASLIRTRAFDRSRSANKRGLSTILRLRIRASEAVAVVAPAFLTDVTRIAATLTPSRRKVLTAGNPRPRAPFV